ncbi:MAG: leucine--tRNA ligase [Patescibacteria group bacterium]
MVTERRKFDHRKIEAKWQKKWQHLKAGKATIEPKKTKVYVLDMFPYPSGAGLHVGHIEGYTATDIYCRYLRMKGVNVLHPMGWDAFGLPTENYAIKEKIHPRIVTEQNINNFRRQLQSLGLSYDWSREINTTDPEYYKWTQWIFLKLFKRGLAYQAVVPINFCPSCQTGLANEEVVAGKCERCKTLVVRKDKKQWLLKITDYAERLLKGLDKLDWPEKIKAMQRNWIGKSEGAEVKFSIVKSKLSITVFTTRPDTLFGATFLCLSPEHPLVKPLTTIEHKKTVIKYLELTKAKSELERTDLAKEKTGAALGNTAINPATGQAIPIWVADCVLMSYGTGAVMGVPAHDERDFEFAHKYQLPIKQVVMPHQGSAQQIKKCAYLGEGTLINSGEFTHLSSVRARSKIIKWLEGKKIGQAAVKYKLRDWVFSRQRYWGEPIPIVHCENCGVVPLSEKQFPVLLPEVKSYAPSGTGESPLATITKWVNTICPSCKGKAKRETDTMPQWAGSSWYWLRFIDPHNNQEAFSQKAIKYWLPVDVYVGGAEHAVLHLLYARFWHKVLFDEGLVSHQEPFLKLINQGLILAPDGRKMSKSLGNVISPEEVVDQYGADTLRMFEMFLGPLEDTKPWNTASIIGIRRYLEKVWKLSSKVTNDKLDDNLEKILHSLIKKVSSDIEVWRFNTAIAALMSAANEIIKRKTVPKKFWRAYLQLLCVFAPHLTEELWQQLGEEKIVFLSQWPSYQSSKVVVRQEIIIQINGKLRDKMPMPKNAKQAQVEKLAQERIQVAKYLEGKKVKKIIYVFGRLINFVI